MKIPEISPREVGANNYRLIDVRTEEEFCGELGHVPGSEWIEMGEALIHALNSSGKEEKIVFICRSGNRSGQVTAYAVGQGFTAVLNMTGGMLLWNDLGLEIEK